MSDPVYHSAASNHTRLRNTREPNMNHRRLDNILQKTSGVVAAHTLAVVVVGSNLEEVVGGILVVVDNRKTRTIMLVFDW